MSRVLTIPLDRGHYEMEDDVLAKESRERDSIPLGFYYGCDTWMDPKGHIRTRPRRQSSIYRQITPDAAPLFCFWHRGRWFIAQEGVVLKYWNGTTWADVTGGTTYAIATSGVGGFSVDYFYDNSAVGVYNHYALVGAKGVYVSLVLLNTYGGTPSAAAIGSSEHHKGLVVVNEDRGMICSGDTIYYSARGDVDDGYDVGGSGELFYIDNGGEFNVWMGDIGGNLFVVRQSVLCDKISIWRKAATYAEDDPLDGSQFEQVASTYGSLPWLGESVVVMNGTIYLWVYGIGLCVLTEGGLKSVYGPILGDNINQVNEVPTHSTHNIRLVADEVYKQILVNDINFQTTYAYDTILGIWNRWSSLMINGKGYGKPGIFCVSDNLSPMEMGNLYNSSDTSGPAPYLYTPAMDLGEPFRWKKLERILLSARGVGQVDIYMRSHLYQSFTLWKTIEGYATMSCINLPADNRFREVMIKITGAWTFLLKSLAVVFSVEGEIE